MSQEKIRKEDALNYHRLSPPGKIEVIPTKPVTTQRDLALAYSPGVAEPCKEIAETPEKAYEYTAKGNLVAVISNGTAVLGLGNIGPLASKPVMEGKGVLFKKFAGIDVFDIEVDATDPDEFIRIVKALEPTFGGVNLEDIKAPECFYIEKELKERMNIPIMHDDQHGTAIISSAALINALEVTGRKIGEAKLVVLGAGAAAISVTRFFFKMGIQPENTLMVDKDGVLRNDEIDENDVRFPFTTYRNIRTFDEAIEGADILLGLSAANIVKPEHLLKMAPNPIIFALANPDPEISYELAKATRPDCILATGRSDHPNQVNNVLGFPYIFRGALDVRATTINDEMKMAAVEALASLAKEPVPDVVNRAYGATNISFGKEYLIPKPLDPRLITTLAPAVARAAIESGVAQRVIKNWDSYEEELMRRVGIDQRIISRLMSQAKTSPKRIIFAEADHFKILKAGQVIRDEGLGYPIFLGNREVILGLMEKHGLDLQDCPIIDPRQEDALCEEYGRLLYQKRKRKGVTQYDATKAMRDRNYFGAAMLELGLGDVFISGLTKDYAQTIKPALQVIGVKPGHTRVAGMYVVNSKKGTFFFADTTVNAEPNCDELVEIIGLTAEKVRFFGQEPRVALLSYSNFGSSKGPEPHKMERAAALAKAAFPGLIIDGEVQANIALNKELLQENYPFSELAENGANTLIFPTLSAGNISYKLLQEIGGAEVIGPILLGMDKPVHILQLGSSVREIVNMAVIGAVEAQVRDMRQKLEGQLGQ